MRLDQNSISQPILPLLKDIAVVPPLLSSPTTSSKAIEKESLQSLVDNFVKKMEEQQTHIKVKMHEKTNTIMVVVVDDTTNEVVREIPSEKLLDMMYSMCVDVGVFLDKKV